MTTKGITFKNADIMIINTAISKAADYDSVIITGEHVDILSPLPTKLFIFRRVEEACAVLGSLLHDQPHACMRLVGTTQLKPHSDKGTRFAERTTKTLFYMT